MASEPSKKILVVDDEPDVERLIRQRMRRDIRSGKYEFLFAGDGVQALARLHEAPDVELVLSDINMPRMDGLTLLDEIGKLNPDLRSVIVSAYGDMENIRTAMNRGAFDFVTKPLDFNDLRTTVDRALANAEMWREAVASRDKLLAIQNELTIANQMQQSILPSTFPSNRQYQVYGSMDPARDVGGDFFDIFQLEDGRVGLAIADVSDKGVPAALFMMSSRTLLKGSAIGNRRPGAALTEVNNLLSEDNDAAMFVTIFYGIYDPAAGTLDYANGGHNQPVLVRPDGTVTDLATTGGIALGVASGISYREAQISLEPGDSVVLYTDGVTEATDVAKEEFSMARLHEVFAGGSPRDAREINDRVFDAVRRFAGGAQQSDDITCLVLHCN